MKKLTLFLVAMFAMINVANAQRAWAYDLELTPSGDSYTFAFKAVTAGDATLVFYKEGGEAGTLNLGSVSAGDNTVTKTSEELLAAIQQSGDFTWGVKMTGSAIAAIAEVTNQSRGIYDFYNMMGVVVDNNTDSKDFGKIYVQMSREGTTQGKAQTPGLFLFDQKLDGLNSNLNVGIQPSLPAGYTIGDDRNKFHRLNINPNTGDLVYSYNIANSPAVFAIDRENMAGNVTNLVEGVTGLTHTNAHCFDENGTLYVMDNASYPNTGAIYKIVDGVAKQFVANANWANASITMASDGRGGLWVSQNRGQMDTYYQLTHVTSGGTIDWYVNSSNPQGFEGSSARDALAYDVERQILAQGRNGKVELYNVTYDATTGLPTVTPFKTVSSTYLGTNIDGLAFDYAGDLYVVNSSKEKFQKFEVPTDNNTCTTPAKKSQVIKLESITLNAHPVKDYSASIVGTMKRAIQNGENTIVLTHEDDGTPHIYNIAHATKTVTEISQEGVVAVDPDNAGDYLAISDIALTEDGKLIACNYMRCSYSDATVGTTRYYIWNDLASTPSEWFTSSKTANSTLADVGYTFAVKGNSDNAQVMTTAVHNNNRAARINLHTVVNGTESAYHRFGLHTTASEYTETKQGVNFQLTAVPLDGVWALEGELTDPTSFAVPSTAGAEYNGTALNGINLGKKYNGASYLKNYNDHHLMVAPYANGDGKLAGVKVLGITDGFDAANLVITNTDLANAIDATAAAATAYVDGDGDLTIYLIADSKVYAFSQKVPTAQSYTVTAIAGEGGTVEGGGLYEEGSTATVTASPAEHYDFVSWTEDGAVVSTTAEYSFTVTKDIELTANFQEHAKYTINAHADDNSKGYVTGGAADIYVGTNISLKATAKTGYYFTQWTDGNTDNPRTITVDGDKEYIAEFAQAYPRVYAYDLDVADNGDSYTFSFKPNTNAVSGNLLLYNEDGTVVVQTHAISTAIVAHTATSITLNKTELPNQADIPWAIELSGNDIPAFAETFADSDLRFARAHAVVDNSPESEYFGRVYVADRRSTKSNSKVYVYNPDFTDLTATNLGLATAGYSRPAVGADGTLYLTGYTDGAEAGIFVVDPADLTKCTQFFNGTYDSDGLYTNNGKEIGSSTSGVGVYGEGKDAVLYTMMEDGSNANVDIGKQPIVCYQIGQENGTVLKQWSDEPTWLVNYPATGYDTYNYGNNDFSATAKGVWVSQNKSNPADRPEIAFVDKTGTIQFMQNSKPCLGGGMTVNADNTVLYIVEDGKILEYAITWNDNKPSLTLSNTYPISLQYISTLSVDYAGNLIACAGTTYKTTDNNVMKVVRFTLPTDNNTTIVPAAKAKSLKLGNRYTVTVVINDESMGEVIGAGLYKEGETAELAAAPAANHRIVNWKNGEDVLSTDLTCSFEVTEDVTINVTFEKIPQYTVTTIASPAGKGSITGGGLYNEGTNVTLTATAHTGYTFVRWEDDDTAEATRTITVTGDITYTAIFDKVAPRAWAYDLRLDADTDPANYIFTFKTTSAGTATLIFKDKDGNTQDFGEHTATATTAEEKTITIAKSTFDAATKDIYWEVELAGEAIAKMAEITDPTRNIYDFYNMMGVVVDNDPNSDEFGKIYVQMALGGTTNDKAQTPGLFLFNQNLDVLNADPNEGIQPTLPSGYTLGGNRNRFHRLNINPISGDLVYSYNISNQPAVFAIDRENMTGEVSNLLAGVTGLYCTSAHCFDAEGTLYVMDIYPYSTTAYAQGWNSQGIIYKVVDGVATEIVRSEDWGNESITMASDGRGGLWVAQNRGQIDGYYQLAHINSNSDIDWAIYDDLGTYKASPATLGTSSKGFTGYSTRGALAYDAERQILAQGRNSAVELFNVTYDATTGVPTLTKFATTPVVTAANIDGLAFDYAGDLYVVNSGTERFYKFVVPTTDNTCTVPAPESQVIQKETRFTVTVAVNDNAMGTATGGGEYVEGETATLEATPAAHHKFVNWTYGSETSTNNPLELIVEGNITVTANFEPVQYTLIAPTNDEDKGTVVGAGTYAHGTVATLTATPKEGYKLLYWSDRSTENPRTITMTKNEAISAYFVKEYTEEPTFKIEKMWENTKVSASTGEGFQAVGWDGKIYMQNKAAGKIQIFSNETDAPVDYATSGIGQKIAVDEAGNMIVCNSTFAAATNNKVLIYPKGSTEGNEVSFTLLQDGRCDFFSASGNIYSAEGGYVYFYCQSTTVVNRVKIANGELVSVDVVGNNITAGNSQNHVMVDIFGNLVAHSRSAVINATINVHTNESMPFALIDHKYGTLGGCSFELGGKELWAYHAGATNYSSEWNIYNMTDSKFLSDDDFYAVDKNNSTNNAANWLNVQVVDENTAYIYQFCPKKAVAMWKVSINRTDLQEFTVTATANNPAMGIVTGEGTYYEDATAILTATPHAGYRFVNWTKAGVEVSTNVTYTFTVTEDVELVANFEALPEITYELNGGVWNKYDWTSKKDMYDAFIADWKAYSGSTRVTKTYEEQYGIGKSNNGIPVTIQNDEGVLDFMELPKWSWLAEFLDALAISQNISTKIPSSGDVHMRFALGNFFGEDNNKVGDSYVDAVDCSGDNASLSAFAPYWGQTFPLPTQPTEEVVLNAPYKEGYLFDGWYATSDFSGAEITVVDETTNGTLYAKWLEHFYTRSVTNGRYGTICLPYGSSNMTGAIFYEVAYLNESTMRVFVDEVTELEAGKPYIFMATSNLIKVLYQGEEANSPDNDNANGLYGTFEAISDGPAGTVGNRLEGNYMLSENQIKKCLGNCKLPAYRAYIKLEEISTTEPSLMPGRRRVALGVQGGNEATGVDNLTEDGIAPAMEGTYDVLGRKFTEPNGTGFYIVNGKKVVIVK